jgi:hypothetical protein
MKLSEEASKELEILLIEAIAYAEQFQSHCKNRENATPAYTAKG